MKVKQLFFLLALMFSVFSSCQEKTNNRVYYINYNFSFPYEIFVNDVLVVKDMKEGLQGTENISLFFTEKDIQKIKVRFFPDLENNLTTISTSSLNKQETVIYLKGNGYSKKIEDLVTNPILESVPYYEQEWSFEAKGIEGIDNLSNSQDLLKIDKVELQKQVIEKYEHLRDLLNEGKGSIIMKEIQTAKNSLFIAENIAKDKQSEYDYNLVDYFNSHKGTLPSLGNFTLKIMGNGRAVAVEYASGKYQGLGILSSEDIPNNILNNNYIILHKPISSDKFEVFRYNCSFTTL